MKFNPVTGSNLESFLITSETVKKKTTLYIAISNYLIREGLHAVFDTSPEVEVVGEAESGEQCLKDIFSLHPDVLIIDYAAPGFSPEDVTMAMKSMRTLKVVAITGQCETDVVKRLVQAGLNGHLLSDCDREEIVNSVTCSARGEKFFCGKVLDRINSSEGEESDHGCEAVNISGRELEILQLVAQGLTTKQIADKLHLSFHTVMTHRKNMMNKLGIKNTAGLIIYAVKENLISPNKFLFSTR